MTRTSERRTCRRSATVSNLALVQGPSGSNAGAVGVRGRRESVGVKRGFLFFGGRSRSDRVSSFVRPAGHLPFRRIGAAGTPFGPD